MLVGLGHAGDGGRRRQHHPARRQGAGAPSAASSASAGGTSARRSASSASASTSSGARPSTRRPSRRRSRRRPDHRRLLAGQRVVDRHAPPRRGHRQDLRPAATRHQRRRRGERAGRVRCCRWTAGASTSAHRLAEGAHAPARAGVHRALGQGLEGTESRRPAALLLRPRCARGRPGRAARPR